MSRMWLAPEQTHLASSLHLLLAVALIGMVVASPLHAQTTREEWLQRRERMDKKRADALQAMPLIGDLASPEGKIANPLALISVKLYPTYGGDQAVVGEVRNDSPSTLVFTTITFAFFDSQGALLGSDYTYVIGSENRRLASIGSYVTVLPPGRSRCFPSVHGCSFDAGGKLPVRQ